MSRSRQQSDETARKGEDLYERAIRERVEPEHLGKFLVLDVASGDYEIDADKLAAGQRLRARRAAGDLYTRRIGYRAVARLGGPMHAARP